MAGQVQAWIERKKEYLKMTVSEFCDGKQLNKQSFTLRTHVDKKSFVENDEF